MSEFEQTKSVLTEEDVAKLQWAEACSAYRTVHDIVIRLISIILPLSIALSGFGVSNKSPLLLGLSALVALILWVLIFSTYSRLKVVWGALLTYEANFDNLTSSPGVYTTFANVHLGQEFVDEAVSAYMEKNRNRQIEKFNSLPSGYIGTPAIVISIGLTLLIIGNIILAVFFADSQAPAWEPSPGSSSFPSTITTQKVTPCPEAAIVSNATPVRKCGVRS